MAKNIVAAQLNYSMMEGVASDFVADVRDYLGEEVDLAAVTLSCKVFTEKGAEVDAAIEYIDGVYLVRLPILEQGRHRYEITHHIDTGETQVLVQGWIGCFAVESWVAPEGDINSPNRTLHISLADSKDRIEAGWLANAAAEYFAKRAENALEGIHIELEEAVRDATAQAKESAAQAAASALSAESSKNEALTTLERAHDFMESFDTALHEAVRVVDGYLWIGDKNTGHYLKGEDGVTPEYIDGYWWVNDEMVGKACGEDGITPHITPDGYWAFGAQKTNVKAAGRDGLDGTAIRRKLIESVEQLPAEEERGVYYYVPKEAAKAEIAFQTYEANDIGLYINGRHVYVEGNPTTEEEWAEAWLAAINSTIGGLTCISCVDAGTNGWYWARIEADFIGDYANGTTIEYGLCKYGEWAGQTCPKNFQPWGFRKMGSNGGYDIYAWLAPDGWVCVGDANDIATAEIYGLMKYGTDSLIESGSPVGRNADGQATVPMADTALAGVGKLGTENIVTSGAAVGLTADGAFSVPLATFDTFGAIKLGRAERVPQGAPVGVNGDGQARVPWAGLGTAGVICLGSQYGQSNPEPYIVGIGATSDHQLANNYTYGGALQHLKPDGWGGRMTWLDEQKELHPDYFGDMYYSGLMTSEQFTQNASSGLILLPATSTLVGGVSIATSMLDSGEYSVPNAAMVYSYLAEHYYTRGAVYTKSETNDEINATATTTLQAAKDYADSKVVSWVGHETKAPTGAAVANYIETHTITDEEYKVYLAQLKEQMEQVQEILDKYIVDSDGITRYQKTLTRAEFAALSSIRNDTDYFVTA